MASTIPKEFKKELLDISKDHETWTAVLLKNTFPNTTGNNYIYDAAMIAHEIATGGGYTQGTKAVTVLTTAYDGENAYIDASNDTFWGPGATFSGVRYVVVFETTTKLVRAVYDVGPADKSVSNGTFTIQWNVGGLIKIS